jgi:dTDP-4-amino-4,6-dideoxygalactose transaminase
MPTAAKHAIPYVRVNTQFREEEAELTAIIRDVLANKSYVADALIDDLEAQLAALCGTRYAVTLNSGTDALMLGMLAAGIGRGDEVLTPPNSFVASTASIAHIGATPVFVDVLPDQNIDPEAIEAAITSRTRAIMAVHLTGRVCRMDRICAIAEKYGLLVIEDGAQAIGSKYQDQPSGSFGKIGCFSTHPLKNLNGCGDGGFMTTSDAAIAARVRQLRSHGMVDRTTVQEWGFVSRMDTLQAAILRFRLGRLDAVSEQRRANAAYYQKNLAHAQIFMPPCTAEEYNTFHTFVIQVDRRDLLQFYLSQRGIKTAIHYPVPIHLQPAAAKLGYGPGSFPVTERQAQRILTLPVNQFLRRTELDAVIQEIHQFFDTSPAV